ncbi:hypothetical protein PPS11_26876 [Pseudomonas putida S11]|nr:hypothetical protein PPS11_26876 [Pseudomonas putida S11]
MTWPQGALQAVQQAVEQADHFADFVRGVDMHAAGQVAIAAGNGPERRDDAADIAHDLTESPRPRWR